VDKTVPIIRTETSIRTKFSSDDVADLQKNPNDTALREKIIALDQTMKPAPAIRKRLESTWTGA
jgi:hypothetical protein